MRRNILSFIIIGTLVFSIPLISADKKKITPELAFKTPVLQLTKPLPSITGWEDDARYIESKKNNGDDKAKLYLIDAKTGNDAGEEKPVVNADEFKNLVSEDIDLSKPLLSNPENNKHIYRSKNDLFLLDVGKKEFKQLTRNSSEEKNPTLSPDGNVLAFTRENNLFVIDLATGKETQLTTDGGEVVYNGWAAWLYYEEIFGRPSRYKAYWWSPDSKRIAFYHFDESQVPMFPLYNSRGQHGTLERTHYPKVGDPNPEVKFGIIEIATGKITWADFNEKDDQYFGKPFWTPDNELWVQWMNRAQNDLKIYSVDLRSGKKKQIYDETQRSWVEWFDDITFLKESNKFIIKTNKDGWMHFYLYFRDGSLISQITTGKWQVVNLEFLDEQHQAIYFTARKEASTRTDFYKIKFNGSELKRLTFGEYTHNVKISPSGSYFITTYSNVSTPSKMSLCDNDGNIIRELGNAWQDRFNEYELAPTNMITIPTSDGYQLPAAITLPPQIEPGKKYPVLISIYGGPNGGSVFDGWRSSMQAQGLAAEGLIQLTVDHRGSGHFGKEGESLMYHCLGKWEMNDYIEAVKWLRKQPYVDSAKICITGGSYGGYVTCMALTYGADYFQYGIASYSVVDWQLYDTHYTERYMGTPSENPDGYAFGSVLTHADKYHGLLRIVESTMDDNTHFQNSLQLIDTLENLGKHFEAMIYPNERHGVGYPKYDHARMESLRFYYENLLEKRFPEELFEKKQTTRMTMSNPH